MLRSNCFILETKEPGSNAGTMVLNDDGAWPCMGTGLICMDTMFINKVLDFVGDFDIEENGRLCSPLISLEHLSLAGYTIIPSPFCADLYAGYQKIPLPINGKGNAFVKVADVPSTSGESMTPIPRINPSTSRTTLRPRAW